MKIYKALKTEFKIDEQGDVRQQIIDRTNAESNYQWAKGFPIIKSEKIVSQRSIDKWFRGNLLGRMK